MNGGKFKETLSMDLDHKKSTHAFYRQILQWVLSANEKAGKQPFFIGFNAPQGAGKTTLTRWLCEQLAGLDLVAITMSIDDFYLTHEAQVALALANPDNPHLQMRGYPGTHDIELGTKTLRALKVQSESQSAVVPRYNKSAHEGKGDRFPKSEWKTLESPPDIVFIEGWMLGFRPNPQAEESDPYFVPINEALPKYAEWYAFFDAFIYLHARDHRFVLDWRVEAEENMKAKGLPGMSREEVKAYAAEFMIAYETFSHTISADALGIEQYLEVIIERNRLPIAAS
ncbi:MAG: hypothetical protein PF904_19345 [Kiritimatiellae bacterium]|jgi:D-glycerate 3-kinase|nr:hypothetical protein [Kiritimatiellia bacterium]